MPEVGTALRPPPPASHRRPARSADPTPPANLTVLMQQVRLQNHHSIFGHQMRDYVEDNMVSKDPLFDKKFTGMLEAALGNATEEDGEQRELARTLLQAWKVEEGWGG